jgi:Transcriptional regulator
MTGVDVTQAVAEVLAAVEAEEGTLAPKKRAVVEAALLCFSEHGYAATATRTIAQRAGVAEATIFRHFDSKADLLIRMVRPVARHLMLPALAEAQAIFADPRAGTEEKIRSMMLARLAFGDRFAPMIRILLQELPVNPELQGLLHEGVVAALTRFVEGMVALEVAAGRMRPIAPGRFLRIIASQLIGYWIARTMVAPGDWDDAEEVAVMAGILARGLAP